MKKLKLSSVSETEDSEEPSNGMAGYASTRKFFWGNERLINSLEELASRKGFQEMASWPIRTFKFGAQEQLNADVVAVEHEMLQFVKFVQPLVQSEIMSLPIESEIHTTRSQEELDLKSFKSNSFQGPDIGPSAEMNPFRSIRRDQAKNSLKSIMVDLKCIEEFYQLIDTDFYFSVFSRSANRDSPLTGEIIIEETCGLEILGDTAVRSCEQKLTESYKSLSEIMNLVFGRLADKKCQNSEEMTERWDSLRSKIQSLQTAIRSIPDHARIEACVAATQAYGVLRNDADFSWLGLRPEAIKNGILHLKKKLRRHRSSDIYFHLVKHLKVIEDYYNYHFDVEEEFGAHLSKTTFVVRESDGSMYFKGVKYPNPDFPKPLSEEQRTFLVMLAKNGKKHRALTLRDFYGDRAGDVTNGAFSHVKLRLLKKLPLELQGLIKSQGEVNNPGYLLELDSSQIEVI